MADPSAYAFAYAVQTDSSGNFFIVDADSNAGLTPAVTGLSIKDDVNDGDNDVHTKIGDTANDRYRTGF